MKIFLFISIMLINGFWMKAQNKYSVHTSDWVFSSAIINQNGNDEGNVFRFSPWFNFQTTVHNDKKYGGYFYGLSLKNIGFIYDVPNTEIRKKFSSYTIGIPLGFKIGNPKQSHLIIGYEFEVPLTFKEKTFVDGVKTKYQSIWFSNRTSPVYHSVFFGFQLTQESSVKVKYCITDFFNATNNKLIRDTQIPYNQLNANVFYLSLTYNLFSEKKLKTPSNSKAVEL